ncbi:hypothetical protein P7K49_036445 [Saguinus oedipus]|uniref:Uncharacterized protein n=1 Tax=Saguinus oedipus TaxID=9490 RepID=A0ABQ9TK47_SAGOE|nr:hypothetical protein P7K49_036445 [Saguinus oedipus]
MAMWLLKPNGMTSGPLKMAMGQGGCGPENGHDMWHGQREARESGSSRNSDGKGVGYLLCARHGPALWLHSGFVETALVTLVPVTGPVEAGSAQLDVEPAGPHDVACGHGPGKRLAAKPLK